METATKTGIDAAKMLQNKWFKKTAEATDLIRNEIADKLTTHQEKQKVKKKKMEDKKSTYHQRKDSKLLMT